MIRPSLGSVITRKGAPPAAAGAFAAGAPYGLPALAAVPDADSWLAPPQPATMSAAAAEATLRNVRLVIVQLPCGESGSAPARHATGHAARGTPREIRRRRRRRRSKGRSRCGSRPP